jgi:site-specific DNA-methyltransferase (adenine-specific)
MIDLRHGDCLELMAGVPAGSVDLILADLPYGSTDLAWDSVIPLAPLWEHYRRVITPTGAIVLTASQPFTTALINAAPDLFKYCWVWEKSIVGGIFDAKNKPMKRHEDVLVFSKGTTANCSTRRMAYHPQGLRAYHRRCKNFMRNRACYTKKPSHQPEYDREFTDYPTSILRFPNDTGLHPTQKPVALMEYLIKTYTNEGDTVMDSCFGSGTTPVACVNTERNFIGMEKDVTYFEVGQRRVREAQTAHPLFA